MTYFTSWDINVFLCLVTLGVPEDVVKIAVKIAKKTHEEFSLGESKDYWVRNSPKLVRWRMTQPLERRGVSLKFQISDILDFPQMRLHVFKRRINMTKEFETEWRSRSIDERQAKVVQWCKFGEERDQLRHQRRLQNSAWGYNYTDNLWRTWEAGAWGRSSYYLVGWDKRVYISQWYEGIHPGRFFLFYKENKIIEERHKGVRAGKGGGYQFPKTPIFDWGPYEQLIEDLRCIDGPGLGESGSKIEHIDDLFS